MSELAFIFVCDVTTAYKLQDLRERQRLKDEKSISGSRTRLVKAGMLVGNLASGAK